MKATESVHFVDKTYSFNSARARDVGIKVGAYHFFRPSVSGTKQAEHFLEHAAPIPGDLRPVIDCEDYDGSGKKKYATELRAFINLVSSELSGVKPFIYTSQYFWTKVGNPDFGDCPLWVVDLSRNPPRLPVGWHTHLVLQHSFEGKVSGITGNVDLDLFNGDEKRLKRYLL